MSKLFGISLATALALAVGLASTPGSARVGLRCAGFYPRSCGANEYCQLPTGSCSPRAWGHCAAVPEICPFIYEPVCGCNGETYPNKCLAEHARVNVRHNGRCS
jgi:hypothetical protein